MKIRPNKSKSDLNSMHFLVILGIMKLLIFSILIFIFGCASAQSERYISDEHFNSRTGKFFNPELKEEKGLSDVIRWLWTRDSAQWPDWVENEAKPKLASNLNDFEMAITYINHSTFLIQLNGLTILTDPIFSERCSPVSFAGPKRVRETGLAFDQLPPIDVVIISHNHYDHMDLDTIKRLEEKFKPQFLVPMMDAKLLKKIGVKKVMELDWWASFYGADEKFKITFTPAQHFSGRGLFDRMESLWGSYMIRFNGHNIFFGGDTGYASHFKEIQKRLGDTDFALLPIGAYLPRWFMKDMHVNPEEAVLAHFDLKSKKSVGMHFGTFQLSDEAIYKPVEDLQRAKLKRNMNANDFTVMSVGQTLYHSFLPENSGQN
jgi:L-ascorbate metabolism protein UlaG (beta-lactamase superfamily)